jgi:hypothetical protein
LRGVPGAGERLGLRLPPHDLQVEAHKAERP